MWTRKEIKKDARRNFKKIFVRMIAVCFILSIFAGEYRSSTLFINSYDFANQLGEQMRDSAIRNSTSLSHIDEFIGNKAANLITKTVSESSLAYNIWTVIDAFVVDQTLLAGILLILFILVRLLYVIFIRNILMIGANRFFIEAHSDSSTKISRMVFLYRRRQLGNPAKVMLLRDVFQIIWSLTIVMGPVKYYEYKMIPYLLAENPQMDWHEAFAKSKMMSAHMKWKMFLLDCSFLGWYCLGFLTFGLLNILYINPYSKAVAARLYITLRDTEYKPELPQTLRRGRITTEWRLLHPERTYSGLNLVLFFFTFSIIGWTWEVFYHYLGTGEIVNRGTLFGPWLPIYGTGGLAVILFMRKWLERPIFTFFVVMTSCSVLEYATSFVLELMYGIKWWDYSGYFWNVNGRICLAGSVLFGLGGCLFIYFIAPHLDELYCKVSKKWRIAICVVLILLFIVDAGYSFANPNMGRGITKGGNVKDLSDYKISRIISL